MPADPSPEEVAAIVAAIEAAWPRPALVSAPAPPPAWRFSGRWWAQPIPVRRDRPWVVPQRSEGGGRVR